MKTAERAQASRRLFTNLVVLLVFISMLGVLMVEPLKMAPSSLPFLTIRKILGRGRLSGVKLSRRSMARGERISTPWAPSPPSTFCHE